MSIKEAESPVGDSKQIDWLEIACPFGEAIKGDVHEIQIEDRIEDYEGLR